MSTLNAMDFDDHTLAKLDVSGDKIKVGINNGDVFIRIKSFDTPKHLQPTYMSIAECDLLIAALQAAKARIKEDNI